MCFTELSSGAKVTADAAVDARDQPGRIPPLPDLVQSCAGADTGRPHGHGHTAGRHQQKPLRSVPLSAAAVVAAPSRALLEVGRDLRRCADHMYGAHRKRRAAPEQSTARRSGRAASASAALVSASALLLLWYYQRRG